MNDDDQTPQVKHAPTYLRDVDDSDPAVYLQQEPTPEEHILTEQTGLHAGSPVPFWMVAKLAVRQRRQARWIDQADSVFRRVKRRARTVVASLAINLTAIGGYALHRAAASGAADERAVSQERSFVEYRISVAKQFDELKADIRELRAELRRLSGNEPRPNSESAIVLPDKLSLLVWPTRERVLCPIDIF